MVDFNIIRCARAVLLVTNLEASRDFYENALGFVVTEADENHLYLRGYEEHNHHSLVLKKQSSLVWKRSVTRFIPMRI